MSGPRNTPTPSEPSAVAETRARIYVVLASGWRYPDESAIAFLRDFTTSKSPPGLADGFSSKVAAQLRTLFEVCSAWAARSPSELLDELQDRHVRLFGHSVRGSCPLYELEYGQSEIIQQTAELADLSGFYSAFGMNMNPSAFERADHMSVECEFMGVLCAKEAWGRQQEETQLAETCSDAQRLFLRDHLARWLPAFAHRVLAADPQGWFGSLASLAIAFITEECRRFEIEAGPQWLELRPVDPARDGTIDCDTAGCGPATAEQLVQIGIENPASAGVRE